VTALPRFRGVFALILMFPSVPVSAIPGQTSRFIAPETVVVPSGRLRLKGFLWRSKDTAPAVLFLHGSGGIDPAHTGKLPIAEAAERLGPVFLKHGYTFLYLFRRGQGLSADQGSFIQDTLQRERALGGEESRKRLQIRLLTTDHLNDAMAGVSFLKSLPGRGPHRIAIAGHSFGGQLTLLAAEHDSTLGAAVVFGAAAASWDGSPELRELLLAAVRTTTVPLMLIHAANDYSIASGKALAGESARLANPHELKIYPPFGQTPDDGHDFVYTGVSQWEDDAFRFLEKYVRH